MKSILQLFIALLTTITINAQSKYGHLTIISEENEPFYLYLNGIQYNNEPLTVIRIEELNAPTFNCKITYSNKRLPSVNIERLNVADYDGYMQDISYLLSTKRRGQNALMVYKIIPLDDMGLEPNREELYLFGKPGRPYRKGSVNSRDVYSRTRRSTFTDTDRRRWDHNDRDDRTHTVRNCHPMSMNNFKEALSTIDNIAFDDKKLTLAETVTATNCLSTDQIIEIIKLFSFEKNKLAYAKYAIAYCSDPNNYFKVVNSFSFSKSKEELSQFITNSTLKR